MKSIIRRVIFIIIIFVVLTSVISLYLLNTGNFLTKFNFISVTNTGLDFFVYFEEPKAVKNYDIMVYDSSNMVVYKNTIDTNDAVINFESLKNNEVYNIVVIAYDEDGNSRSVEEKYSFLWDGLSFSSINSLMLNNDADYSVFFDGDFSSKDYKLNIKKGRKLIDSVDINDEMYTIDNALYKDKSIKLTLEIVDSSKVIDTFYVYNKMNPVSDIVILNPKQDEVKEYNDVVLSFEGGDNATSYLLELYDGKKLIRKKEISSKNVVLSNNLFEKASSYVAKISAFYEDIEEYTKSSTVMFSMNEKETLKPVYVNYNYRFINRGSKIKLLSPDDNAVIYYTIDGTDPSVNGIKYEEEIVINEDIVLKTIAKEDKKNDSIISTYEFKVGKKNQYKVYLSPSNQSRNLGVGEVGYTNEKVEMNDLTNYIEKRLKENGVIVYRNDVHSGINRWTQDSTYLGVDLHLAIHSNASDDHKSYGIETWINDANSSTYSLAQNIQSGLMGVYYNKEDSVADRGVKYAQGSLGEVNPLLTPCGILLEIGHHDYKEDAEWVMKNKELIGNKVADSILEYFQIK